MINIVFHKTDASPVEAMEMLLGSKLTVDTVKSKLSAMWLDNYHRDAMLGLLDCTDWLTKNGMSSQGPKVTTSIHAITKMEALEQSEDTSITTQAYQWLKKTKTSLNTWLESNNPTPQRVHPLFWSDDPFDEDVFRPLRNTLLAPLPQVVDNKRFTDIAAPMRMTLTMHPESGAQLFSEVFKSPRTAMGVIFNHEYMHAYQKYRCRQDPTNPGSYAQAPWNFTFTDTTPDVKTQNQIWGAFITYWDNKDTKLTTEASEKIDFCQTTLSEIYADVGSMVLQYARTGEMPELEGLAVLREQGCESHETQDALRDVSKVLALHDPQSINNMEVVHQITSDIAKNTVLNRLTTMLNSEPEIQMWFEDLCVQHGTSSQVFIQNYDAHVKLNLVSISKRENEISM